MFKRNLWVVPAIILFLTVPGWAGERIKFATDSSGTTSSIVWESRSLLGAIVGTTAQVRGFVVVDPSRLSQDPVVEFEVDLASFDTGNSLRNRHMREKYLQTEKFPIAHFRAIRIESDADSLESEKTIRMIVNGILSLHGIEKPIEIPGEVSFFKGNEKTGTFLPGAGLNIFAEFKIKLSDFTIETPRFLINKMNDEVKIKINLRVTAERQLDHR
jgi:polyisoprenoid-binding protein YceI